MIKEGFENRFSKGDIVYWCEREVGKYTVRFGVVEDQYSDGVYINFLELRERRRIDGIPLDEFRKTCHLAKYKKLPKDWSYDTLLYELTSDPWLPPSFESYGKWRTVSKQMDVCEECEDQIAGMLDKFQERMKDEWLDGISPARILRDTLKEMEATDQMFRNSIIEIKEIVPNKVYEYRFVDGDIQKTVCSDSDQFSMEDSITIAYAKHFMGGSGVYNRAVDKVMKLFANQKAAEEKAKKEAEAAKIRQEKKAKKRAERIARKREAEIELQAEAYRRAMQSIAEERSNRKFEKHKKPKEK